MKEMVLHLIVNIIRSNRVTDRLMKSELEFNQYKEAITVIKTIALRVS